MLFLMKTEGVRYSAVALNFNGTVPQLSIVWIIVDGIHKQY